VYGNTAVAGRLLAESEPCRPADDYARTKLTAEGIARDSAASSGISIAVARIFNVIGPGQHERHVAGRIAAEFAASRSGARRRIELGHLHSTRDFIDVRDVAQGLIIAAVRGEGTLNLGSGCERKVEELVNEFSRASGVGVPQMLRSEIPAGVERSVADITRIRALGFAPAFCLRASIEDIWAYYDALWGAIA
jgi:GDP-4-dehydro-6-deoxy-D-mannose reductase